LPGAARKVRLLLVDVHDISRRSFRQLLDAIGSFEIVGDTGDTAEALSLAETRHPDVVLMSVRVRGSSGIEMTRQIRAMSPAPQVVILTLYDSPAYIQEALLI
jgi:DNA-binding NarL/FixJ family response regulator